MDWFAAPTSWAWVVLPAVLTAVVVRLDAVWIGPYFALSSLISAMPSQTAQYFYSHVVLRRALLRRFVYPAITGFAVASFEPLALTDVLAIGILASALLIWPLLFQGWPWWVPRRTWHLPVLYGSFVVAYGALTVAGALVQVLLVRAADGDLAGWVVDQLLGTVMVSVVGLFALGVFSRADRMTSAEGRRREALGGEVLSGHDVPPDS